MYCNTFAMGRSNAREDGNKIQVRRNTIVADVVVIQDCMVTQTEFFFTFLISALENELLKEIEPPSSAQPRLQPLENILAAMVFTPTTQLSGSQGSSKQELSKEGTGVIDMLPDLNFMSAKVLMFPVKGTPDD